MKKIIFIIGLLLFSLTSFAQQNEVSLGFTYGFRENSPKPGYLLGYERIYDKWNIGVELARYHVEFDRSVTGRIAINEWVNREIGLRIERKLVDDLGLYFFAKPSVAFSTRKTLIKTDLQDIDSVNLF